MKIKKHLNSTELKTKNKVFTVIKPVVNVETQELHKHNIIHIKGLTSELGDEPGVKTIISKNGKIKETYIGVTDEGLEDLFRTLAIHLNK